MSGHRLWLAALLAGSMALELGLLLPNARMPPVWDEAQYQRLAEELLRTGHYPGAFRPPAYPAALALAHGLAPAGTPFRLSAGLLQILLAAVALLLVYRLTRVCFGPRAGLVAAGLFGFYPTLVAHTHLLWSEVALLAPLAAALLCLMEARQRRAGGWALAAGALLGLAALTREFALWFAPVAAAWLGACSSPGRARLRAAALVLAGMLLVVAPWTLRNARLLGAFVPISSNTWTPLFHANNEGYLWGARRAHDFYRAYPDPLEREAFARQHALDYILAHQPGWALERLRVGLPRLLWHHSLPLRHLREQWYGVVRREIRGVAVVASVAAYGLLLVGFAFGAVATRWNADRALLLLFLLYATAVVLPFPVATRYRLPLLPAAIPFAAAWLARAPATAGRLRHPGRLVLALLAAGGLLGLASARGFAHTAAILSQAESRAFCDGLNRALDAGRAPAEIPALAFAARVERCVAQCERAGGCLRQVQAQERRSRRYCRARVAELGAGEGAPLDAAAAEAWVAECVSDCAARGGCGDAAASGARPGAERE